MSNPMMTQQEALDALNNLEQTKATIEGLKVRLEELWKESTENQYLSSHLSSQVRILEKYEIYKGGLIADDSDSEGGYPRNYESPHTLWTAQVWRNAQFQGFWGVYVEDRNIRTAHGYKREWLGGSYTKEEAEGIAKGWVVLGILPPENQRKYKDPIKTSLSN